MMIFKAAVECEKRGRMTLSELIDAAQANRNDPREILRLAAEVEAFGIKQVSGTGWDAVFEPVKAGS